MTKVATTVIGSRVIWKALAGWLCQMAKLKKVTLKKTSFRVANRFRKVNHL